MELKQAVVAFEAIEKFTNTINNGNVSPSDLTILGEINSEITTNLEFLKKWIKGRINFDGDEIIESPLGIGEEPWLGIEPTSEWKKIFDMNLMVSDKGTIYSIDEAKILEPYFVDGDLRVLLGDNLATDTRRAAPIVTKAFAIHSGCKGDTNFIIAFKDGDRRNLRPSNLYWMERPAEQTPTNQYLIEDICRRILQYDGDVEKILEQYHNSKPEVRDTLIRGIMKKQIHTVISDRFFVLQNDKIFPRTDAMPDPEQNEGLDVAGFLMTTGDKRLSGDLLRDKIKKHDKLSINEKVIIVFMAMESIGGKRVPDVKTIANVIKSQYGTDEIPYDFISQVREDYSSEIAHVFGR